MRDKIIIAAVLIYLVGFFIVNKSVRDACTHGNCTHGWYSKYNKKEKNTAKLWIFGFPIASYFFFAKIMPSSNRTEKKKNSIANEVVKEVRNDALGIKITIPPSFNDSEKRNHKSAAQKATVESIRSDAVRSKHKELIKQDFSVPEDVARILTKDNLLSLKKYGVWMQALENGQIQPITKEQRRFLDVCKGFQKPSNPIEIAWYNYKKVSSRLNGGDFGYHSNTKITTAHAPLEKCNACGRTIDFCICSQ